MLRRLRQFAQRLAAALESTTTTAEEVPIESDKFLRTMLQLVAERQGDAQQVYLVLAQHQDKLNESLLRILREVTSQLLADNPEQKQSIAANLIYFGNLINQFPLGQRWLNIELSIAAYQQALTMMTQAEMPVNWAITMNNLAIAYSSCTRGDSLEERLRHRADNLEQAIECYQQALSVMTQNDMPVEWAQIMNNLAVAYSDRVRGDRADNLEQAIKCYQQVLSVMTQNDMPVEWANTIMNLANAYSNRIRGDKADNLEQAIECYQQALTIKTHSAAPVEWAETMDNLASAYSDRIRGNRASNLEQAIKCYQQALMVRTQVAMPVEWATTMNNLARVYCFRIRGDRADNLEQAIEACKQALNVRTQVAIPIDWAETMNNLAIAYRDRIRGDRADNLEQAIEACKQALSVRTQTAMPIEWATTMITLANAYRNRIRGDRADNLEQAIEACKQVLSVMTQTAMPVGWATTMNNLANAYSDRIRGDRADNLEQAIKCYQQALIVRTQVAMPVEWATTTNNLARVYYFRIRGDQADNLEQAIASYQQALDVFRPNLLPNDCRRTAGLLANLYAEEQRWAEAVQPYEMAMQAAEILYQSSLFRSSQEAELAETNDLYRRAAYALARTGNLEAAAVTLERGRARGLSETLQRDGADLEEVSRSAPELYRQYQQAVEQLRQLEAAERATSATPDSLLLDQATLRQQASQIHDQLQAAIQLIRQLPGYADFLAQPDFADLAAAVKPGVALVYLVSTLNGTLALLLHHDPTFTDSSLPSIKPIWLDSFTEASLQELLVGPPQEDALGGWFGAYNNRQSDCATCFNTIDRITAELWDNGIGTLVQELSLLSLHQVVLIPTGYLSLLPLHAAWTADDTTLIKRRYALNVIPLTYAPNAQSIRAAQSIADRTPASSLLAIDQPSHTGADPLPNSTREVKRATATFPQHQIFRHDQATTKAILSALPQHNVLHFSCHGYATLDEPLSSGLAMAGDDLLTLRDLLNLKLSGVRLAILSACETGLPGTQIPDEVVSLPTGLLQAGVAGVVASLWSISDLSTMMLLIRFYDYWRIENQEPASALRQAQKWIRDTTNGEKIAYFKDSMATQSAAEMPTSTADYLYKSLILSRPNDRDFAHPFHWAAFSYTGV